MLVTVIIPNYNHERFLKQRIDSVLEQTYLDFEIIILDDNSTDKSLDIIEQYSNHNKVSCVKINKENSGSLFKQWIKGISLATGKYIWIAESDDYAAPDFLEHMVAKAETNKNTGLVFCDSKIVDVQNNVIDIASNFSLAFKQFKALHTDRLVVDDTSFFKNLIVDLTIWNASSVLFKTDILKAIDFNILKQLKNAGDMFVYIALALNHELLFVNKSLNFYRIHNDNATKANLKSGVVHRERITIINYFLPQLVSLEHSKSHLNQFLKRNFLTAVDFKLFNKVKLLLKAYYNFKLISFNKYISLTLFVNYNTLSIKTPDKYRVFIKKVLAK